MNLKQHWDNLPPKKKRWIAVGSLVAGVVGVLYFTTSPAEKKLDRGRHESIKSVLTDKSTREVSMDSMAANLKQIMNEQKEIKREQERLKKEGLGKKSEGGALPDDEAARLRQDVDRLIQMAEDDRDKRETGKSAGSSGKGDGKVNGGPAEGAPAQEVKPSFLDQKIDYNDPASIFRNAPTAHSKGRGQPQHPGQADGEGGADKPVAGLQPEKNDLKIVSFSQPEAKEKDKPKDDEALSMTYLPAGSIITGTLINGMDAPTGQGARKDPFPSTMRIQKEAILPNRFRADVRECFLIVSGYGDLSSERAYLRGETLSCVRDDGGVIEARLDGYVVGEDGKAGARGRLVSKQGQIIAKSLMAGFLGGASKAFDVNPIPVINTSGSNKTEFQSPLSADLFQGAAVKGASNAMERIAKYYIEMAEGIFPVVEIDAGRQMDVVITRGTRLQIRNAKKKR